MTLREMAPLVVRRFFQMEAADSWKEKLRGIHYLLDYDPFACSRPEEPVQMPPRARGRGKGGARRGKVGLR